ncbi:MAG: ATP-binding cassette domain-containing protein [Treponema sp.]|nr:ATP-binding cassette domain-containing protein [Treponema sp.]
MPQAIVETKNLKKYFKVSAGMLHAVDGVNINIEKGKTLGVVGESGCGKSTLGRVILQLIKPTDGDIFFEGNSITKHSAKEFRKVQRQMQIIFQDPYSSINPRMSVQEIIAEPMLVNKVYKTSAEVYSRTAKLMDTVGLARRLAGSYPHELDGGRRQRIGVARALSLDPKFIVCDEPVSALDVSIQAQILNLLMDLQDEFGLTYLFITHDLAVVKHISDEIMVMYLGKSVEQAQVKQLFDNPVHPYTQALLDAIPIPDTSMKNRKINVVRGEVTSPINPKPGCRFAPRCPRAIKECTEKDPELLEISPGHFTECILLKK